MLKFITKRLIFLLPLLIGISIISFFMMHLAPGDPTAMFTDPNTRPEDLARIRANWGLDKPVAVQYFYWLGNFVRGDFGTSLKEGRPVTNVIFERLPATLLLMGTTMVIILLITIPLGVLSAVKKNTLFDHFVTVFSFIGMSIPTFWLSLVLMMAFSLYLGWFPSGGMSDPLLKDPPFYIQIFDVARHMILPILVMVIGGLAGLTRYQRSSMLEVLREDYIRTARAKGLPERTVIFKHALRNALIPIITIMGLSLPDLFGGAFIIETIFSWPGMGRLGVQSIFMRDFPVVMGIVMISGLLIVMGNFLADICYALVDPRIRYGEKK
ncbi:MAG: ABC transporter permease [bacterium]